jgi:hypothetical protein
MGDLVPSAPSWLEDCDTMTLAEWTAIVNGLTTVTGCSGHSIQF